MIPAFAGMTRIAGHLSTVMLLTAKARHEKK